MKSIFSFLILTTSLFAQNRDYIGYHKNINKAEALFFMENKTDSALFYYEKVFKDYDFIFVKDLVNAAQIAVYSKKPYRKYIEQGFEQGLKLSHLENFPLFHKLLPILNKDKNLLEIYNIKRKEYIKKIDFKYLDWIYKMAIKDQQNKHEKYKINMSKYNDVLLPFTNRLIDSIVKKGFPGDRLLGVGDSTIFKEIGKPYLDLYEQRKKDKRLFYMNSDEKILSQHWPQIIFVHNNCSYFLYESIFLNEIKKGNIHPRDVGLIYDNVIRYKSQLPNYCDGVKIKGAYLLNIFTDYTNYSNKKQTNAMRNALNIVPIEVDAMKREYEVKYGFKLFTGFWFCR
nr:hypothetical protein [uncultured Flavobacterium sp.]